MRSSAIRYGVRQDLLIGEFEMSPETIAKLLADLLAADRTTTKIDNGVLTITQNGQAISLNINSSSAIATTISRF